MKKIKGLALVAVFSLAMVSPQQVEAKERSFAHIYDNGCIGIRTYHTFLWWSWVTDEIIACP